jgi:hypothetical protein
MRHAGAVITPAQILSGIGTTGARPKAERDRT